jgi:hypothetical protein
MSIISCFPGGGGGEIVKAVTSVNKPSSGSNRHTYTITGLGFSSKVIVCKWVGALVLVLIWDGAGDKNLLSSWEVIYSGGSASTIHSISVSDDGLVMDATFYNIGYGESVVSFTLLGVA